MKQGYCTIYSDLDNEVAWRLDDGSPVLYNSIQEAKEEIDDDMSTYEGQTEGVPARDDIAIAVQLDENRWQIKDLSHRNLFIWDITKL